MTRFRLLTAGWLLVLALSALLPLSAIFHGVVHVGPTRLAVPGTLTRPVVSLGGDVILSRGSRQAVVVVFGNVYLHGTASADLVAVDGHVFLERHAVVDGDVLSVLGGIYRAPQVVATGRLGGVLHSWDGTSHLAQPTLVQLLGGSVRLGLAAGLALLLVGTCLTVVFPWQVVLISTTLRATPLKSLAAGLLGLVTFLFLVVPLGLSLAGLPFALLLSGAAGLAWLFGITAAALVGGRMVTKGPASLVWATAAGLVMVAVGMAVPLVGPLLVTALGLAGTGALAVALITRSRPVLSLP